MILVVITALLAVASARSPFFRRPVPFPRPRPEPFPRPKPAVDCVVRYSDWTPCSVPCGPGGKQQRWGEIIKQARFGGKRCGPLEQERPCQGNTPCDEPKPVDCQVWFGQWSQCSKNCGGGFQWRRGVIEVEPKNGGRPCPKLEQEQPCNTNECDEPRRDCQVWFGEWSQCSTSCGGGFQWRRGVIEVEPASGGKPCPKLEQEQPCNDFNCDEPNTDCEVKLSEWSKCSKPCGGGIQSRRSIVVVPQSGSGKPCIRYERDRECNTHACTTPPVDCEVTYSEWTTCSKPCGGGVSNRWGRVQVKAENGGAPCPPLEEQRDCNEHLCDIPVIDCEVQFTQWSQCSVPCGGGTQRRWGRKIQEPSNGGKPCPELEQERVCNEQPCLTPVDCQLWFPEWSSCSASCGGGFKWRRGLIEVEPQNGGKPCPPIEVEEACNDFECDQPNVGCKIRFAAWSECSQACGGGFQWRRAAIVQQPEGAGKPCPPKEELEEERACNTFACTPEQPRDCLVKFSQWTQCSKPCGGGVERRWGRIEQKPDNGGKPCPQLEQERPCNEQLCTATPVDCKVVYTEYTECSAACGGGTQRRWGRKVVNPENGGAPCPPLEEERPCNTQLNCVPEVIDCIVKYTDWTPCSKLCGGGTRQRWGEVVQRPSPGGAPCGPLEQSERCNTKRCAPKFNFFGK